MNRTFSLEQTSKTGNFDCNLILRQYNLDLMATFTKVISVNPNLIQAQIAKELCCSSSTLQRFRRDIKMISP